MEEKMEKISKTRVKALSVFIINNPFVIAAKVVLFSNVCARGSPSSSVDASRSSVVSQRRAQYYIKYK